MFYTGIKNAGARVSDCFLKEWREITTKAKANIPEIDQERHVQMFKKPQPSPEMTFKYDSS